MSELSIEPFANVYLDGLVDSLSRRAGASMRLTSSGLLAR